MSFRESGLGLHVVFTGAPGCGKGTQARILKEKVAICHLSTGEMLRAEAAKGTPLGLEIKALLDKGEFATDEMIINMVSKRIDEDDCKNGYVLDGFPRTIPQAESLTEALDKLGQKMDFAIDVDVPDESIINRMSGRRACLSCGATYHIVYNPTRVEGVCDACGQKLVLRDDDKPETVKKRLTVYHDQTQPLIEYYKKAGILKSVDGTQDLNKVFEDIEAVLEA